MKIVRVAQGLHDVALRGTRFHGRGSAFGVRRRRLVDVVWRLFLGRIAGFGALIVRSRSSSIACAVHYIVLAIVLLFASNAAEAASIEVKHLDAGGSLVVLDGDMELGDVEQFQHKVATLSKATVAFRSDGGSLLAGIRIGMLIRVKNFTTIVPDAAQCASACAVAWLGGAHRFLGAGSKVGFHAAYVQKAGGATESGPGNAVLGAYLDQIGLPEDAIVYITQAAPNAMKWLSLQDAAQHGIEVA